MNKVKNIICHQVLHGYSDGHSMLASSMEFPAEVKRLMLTMSDMSGHSMTDGYEEYLTGYHIKDLNMFVVAKTWYAQEMERPGCVWTHSILFNFQDLIKLNSKNQIQQLFKRPEKNYDREFYSSTLNLVCQNSSLDRLNLARNLDPLIVKNVIFELYNKPAVPVLIIGRERDEFEDLILSIWLQQWPRLRRNFSFCTGAINPRLLQGKLLDLQITPGKRDGISKAIGEVSVIDSMRINVTEPNGEWLSVASMDLFQPMLLRDFFINYGADLKPDRSSFKLLVELFLYFENPLDNFSVNQTIDYVGKQFESSDEAQNIKSMILEGDPVINKNDNFEEVLVGLATTNYYKSFEKNKQPFLDRAQKLFEVDSNFATKTFLTLVNHNINPIGVELLTSVSKLISSLENVIFKRENRKLLLVLLHLNPEIAYKRAFWEVTKAEQRENLNILLSINEEHEIKWQKVVNVLVEEDVDIEALVQRVDGIIGCVLNCLNENNFKSLNSMWVSLLKSYPNEILTWLSNISKLEDQLLELLLNVLNPNSREVAKFGCRLWNEILSNSNNENSSLDTRLKAFCVAVAFKNKGTPAFELLSKSIDSVYLALRRSELDYDSWRHIEVHTKPLKFWNDWDKCKKLLNALVDKFRENKWPFKDVGKMFDDREVIGYLANRYNHLV